MEGERILRDLKAQKCTNQLLEDTKNYLAPLNFKDPLPSSNTLSKLEVFSLKLFKQSLELAKQPSPAPHLIALCHLAASSLQVCAGVSGKVSPLSFEKLLLHFIQLCLSRGEFKDGLAMCAVLRGQLSRWKEGKEGEEEARRKEEDTLLKHAFELAWKAALSTEQDGGVMRTECSPSDPAPSVAQMADVCLDLREEAFTCLLSTTDVDASFVASRLLKSSLRYQKLIVARGKGQRRKCYQRLHHFHTSLLLLCDLPALLSGLQEASLAVEYLTHLVKVAHYSGQPVEAQQWLQRAEQLCGSLDHERQDGGRKRTGKRRGGKPESSQGSHAAHFALVQLVRTLVQLPTSDWSEDGVARSLELGALATEKVVRCCQPVEPGLLLRLCDDSEEVFTCLEEQQERSRRGEHREEGGSSVDPSLLSSDSFSALSSLVLSYVQLVETRLGKREKKNDLSLERAARSSQLSALSLVTRTLLDLLISGDEYPDIETPRSSEPPALLTTPPPHPKQTLVESCLRLLNSSRDIISRASSGVLAGEEHRWLGSSAYNLGLALFRAELVAEACPVLQLSCEELRAWCEGEEGDRERGERWEKTQLLKKTFLLVDCQEKSGCYGDVMATLQSTLMSLPARQLTQPTVLPQLVSHWVRGEKEMTLHQMKTERVWSGSSLLDEALCLLETVTSTPHIFTPSLRHQAQHQLAIANILKAIETLQRRIGSCNLFKSHDSATLSHDQDQESHENTPVSHDQDQCLHLVSGQCQELVCGEVERYLLAAVEQWCGWQEAVCGGELGAGADGLETTHHYLQLTAALCSATRQPHLTMRSLGALTEISKHSPIPSLTASYQRALAHYCQLGVHGADVPWGSLEKSLQGAVREEAGVRGRAAAELQASFLSCRLALAARRLSQGKTEKCRDILMEVVRDPLLSRHSLSSHHLAAQAKILTSRYLSTRRFQIRPLKGFLNYLLTNKAGALSCPHLSLTAQELAASAVKTLISLTEHCSTGVRAREGRGVEGEVLSSDPQSWSVLVSLLEGLLLLARLHLWRGAMREALYYAREGANLARRMALGAWFTMFLLLLSETHQMMGSEGKAKTAQSTLTQLHSLLSSTRSHSDTICERLMRARRQAVMHLDLCQPSQALAICKEAIADAAAAEEVSVEQDLQLAGLHLTAGQAVLQEVQCSRPVLLEELWGNTHHKQPCSKRASHLTWLSLVPAPFSLALSHFASSLQLSQPACSVVLQREAYRWLSLLLSPYHLPLSTHCLLLSSQLSLSCQATLMLGKKIRKFSCPESTQLPFEDILLTLQGPPQPPPGTADTVELLVTARNVLQPPHHPPPLSFTQSLISSLPEGCQLTTLCLAPTLPPMAACSSLQLDTSSHCQPPSQQEHLVISVVGRGKEPLLIKIPIEARELLVEFEEVLHLSEKSMKLSEKRAWWTTRRQLDKRIKELVEAVEFRWLGDWWKLLVPPPSSKNVTATHLLSLDRSLQHLPWESTSVLTSQAVGRTPSLIFTVAHYILQSDDSHRVVDPARGYFVLNPRGDLPATEKRFSSWFTDSLGWSGVVRHAPSPTEYSEGLEKHDVFVYCGHGTGREYLSTDDFQLLRCQATTMLMGCSSGKLVVDGACDPTGMALSYLVGGCPSMVAVLWDVTDGDIDRLSKTLLQDWLKGDGKSLPVSLSTAKTACKLQGLNGYAAVVYGNPSIAVKR